MALGTAQWGMSYGITNSTGPPSDPELDRMLRTAATLGIDTLDTARAYQASEARIGQALQRLGLASAFRIVTKLSPDILDQETRFGSITAFESLRSSFDASVDALSPAGIDTLLFHRGSHRIAADGRLWAVLQQLRDRGLVRRVGISASQPSEAIAALDDQAIDVMQVPASLLDQRLARSGFFEHALERGIEVHVRSVFLQGIAHLPIGSMPRHLIDAIGLIREVETFADQAGRTPAEVWLDYARTLPADRLVLGFESEAQLLSSAERFQQTVTPCVSDFAAGLVPLPDHVLDPSRWPR